MVLLSKIYTRGGDGGQTSLGSGGRVAKHALRVEAYGTVDEANAVIGMARLHTQTPHTQTPHTQTPHTQTPHTQDQPDALPQTDAMLARIQNDLFDVGADLCTPEGGERKGGALRITATQTARLESEIDTMNATLEPLKSFILPGGSVVAGNLHLARCVVRRAERLICALAEAEPVSAETICYVNRLSDHLFVLARVCNDNGATDVLWQPGAHR